MHSKPSPGTGTRVAVIDAPEAAEPVLAAGNDPTTAGPGLRRAGRTGRVMLVVTAAACGQVLQNDSAPPVDPSKPAMIGRGPNVAHAAEREEEAQSVRSRVSIILKKPDNWNKTALAYDRTNPDEPLVDTRDAQAPVNARAVETGRIRTTRTVVITLLLPRGEHREINVELGVTSGETAEWKFAVQPTGPLETYGTEAPLEPIDARLELESAGSPTPLGSSTPVDLTGTQWVNGKLCSAAVGEVTNAGPDTTRVNVTSDAPTDECGLGILVNGELHDAATVGGVQADPDSRFGVVAYEKRTVPDGAPRRVNIQVQPQATK